VRGVNRRAGPCAGGLKPASSLAARNRDVPGLDRPCTGARKAGVRSIHPTQVIAMRTSSSLVSPAAHSYALPMVREVPRPLMAVTPDTFGGLVGRGASSEVPSA